jgi:hypothetical protein
MFIKGNHAMVDIETLSTKVSARVLQIAVVVFDASGILAKRSWLMDQSRQSGRSIDVGTLDFWLKDGRAEKLKSLLQGEASFDSLLNGLNELSYKFEIAGWWAHSPSFDMVILEDLFRTIRATPPWSFRCWYDTRTLALVTGTRMVKAPQDEQHDALADAEAQALWVVRTAAGMKK